MLKEIKLHLGCGDKRLEGFINVDIRPHSSVDIIDDISQLTKFEDNSVSLIYASHVLEHFGRHKYMDVLKLWHQKLKVGGVLRLSVPDFEKVVELYNSGEPLRTFTGLLYGGQTYNENYHYITFDYTTLREELREIGFDLIHKWDWRYIEHGHIDDYSQSYLPHMDKENGTLMSLNVEAQKMLKRNIFNNPKINK